VRYRTFPWTSTKKGREVSQRVSLRARFLALPQRLDRWGRAAAALPHN